MAAVQAPSVAPRVLVIDDDSTTTETFVRILTFDGFAARGAITGREGILVSRSFRPQVVLVDLKLSDISGLEVLRELEPSRHEAEFIVITGFADVAATVAAMKLGAANVLEKPVFDDQLVAIVRESIERTGAGTHSGPVRHALRRWADVVVKAVDSPSDVPTLRAWGRFTGASTGALRNWCRTAGLSPRRSLCLARMLRAVVLGQRFGTSPENLLDVVDRRTLVKLLAAGGCQSCRANCLPRVDDFLYSQRFIDNSDAIVELTSALRRSGGRFVGPPALES